MVTTLEKADLIAIYQNNSWEEMSKMFGVSKDVMYRELRKQRHVKQYGDGTFQVMSLINEIPIEIFKRSDGAWMNSKERQSFKNLI